jgi:antitoxin ParD1/3/4
MVIRNMYAEKLSVSLPAALAEFVEQYRTTHACKSRSQVIEHALLLLRQRELEQAYGEAARENRRPRRCAVVRFTMPI